MIIEEGQVMMRPLEQSDTCTSDLKLSIVKPSIAQVSGGQGVVTWTGFSVLSWLLRSL